MPKLTDTQLVILSAAAKRDDGAALPPPKSLNAKGGALTTVLKSLLKKGMLEEQPASAGVTAWREADDGRPMMLAITKAGLQALDGGTGISTAKSTSPGKAPAKKATTRKKAPVTKPKDRAAAPAARQGSKQALLIGLLERKTGASLDEIVEATGWQPHSVRGAISGTLKKKLGLTVTSEKTEGRGRVYRIGTGG
ncbi:DUF3489 domain-containing protein [Pelagibius sp.]|uniref:DUF3489 domain-containing protein n=1 Tax=Pelagibius sp. TaxID=1931238 RepID=UPI003B511043